MASDVDRAFNEGCDARLAGLTILYNPYSGKNHLMAASWNRGWRDVHLNWGAWCKRRVNPPPPFKD